MGRAFKAWLFPFVTALILALFVYVLRGNFDLFGLSDAFLFPGIFTVGFVLLRLIARTGTYDVAGYGLTSFRDAFRRDRNKTYDSVYEYQERHRTLRKNKPYHFWPTLIIGIMFILVAYLLAELALMGSL